MDCTISKKNTDPATFPNNKQTGALDYSHYATVMCGLCDSENKTSKLEMKFLQKRYGLIS